MQNQHWLNKKKSHEIHFRFKLFKHCCQVEIDTRQHSTMIVWWIFTISKVWNVFEFMIRWHLNFPFQHLKKNQTNICLFLIEFYFFVPMILFPSTCITRVILWNKAQRTSYALIIMLSFVLVVICWAMRKLIEKHCPIRMPVCVCH